MSDDSEKEAGKITLVAKHTKSWLMVIASLLLYHALPHVGVQHLFVFEPHMQM